MEMKSAPRHPSTLPSTHYAVPSTHTTQFLTGEILRTCTKMTDSTMIEISKGVWWPRYRLEEELTKIISGRDGGTATPATPAAPVRGRIVLNPEDDEYDEDATWAAGGGGGEAAAPEHTAPTLRVVPATLTALEKAFKNYPAAVDDYNGAAWNDVPDLERPWPFVPAWYSCVKRYRLIKYGGARLIIEVELIGGTTLRHIVKLSQVKGVLTKSNTHGHVWIEEVIIELRKSEQLKLKFSGAENALAFHLALEDAM